jgi:hypothetical protein
MVSDQQPTRGLLVDMDQLQCWFQPHLGIHVEKACVRFHPSGNKASNFMLFSKYKLISFPPKLISRTKQSPIKKPAQPSSNQKFVLQSLLGQHSVPRAEQNEGLNPLHRHPYFSHLVNFGGTHTN